MGLSLAVLALSGSGCASVSVREVARRSDAVSAPQRIFVRDFRVEGGAFDFASEPDTAQRREALAHALTLDLVGRLRHFVAPAWRLPDAKLPPPPGWLVWGQIDRVEVGNLPLRVGIGFGTGGTKLETTFWIYDLAEVRTGSANPFLVMRTTGGSGAEPGLVTLPVGGMPAPPLFAYQVGSKTWSEHRKGTGQDTDRTARMIAAAISDELAARGVIPPGQRLRPKRGWRSSFEVPENLMRN
jgi:hypothetical protein